MDGFNSRLHTAKGKLKFWANHFAPNVAHHHGTNFIISGPGCDKRFAYQQQPSRFGAGRNNGELQSLAKWNDLRSSCTNSWQRG